MIRWPPAVGALVAIEVSDVPGGVVTRRVTTIRDHGDGRYTCCLDAGGGTVEVVTIAPAIDHDGWVCVEPPADLAGAIHLAGRVLRGEPMHGSATGPLLTLARALIDATGAPKVGAPRPHTPMRVTSTIERKTS